MQLLLEASRLFNESMIVDILKTLDIFEKECSRINDKKAHGKKLTVIEKEYIEKFFDPVHTYFINRGFTENESRQMMEIGPYWFANFINGHIIRSIAKLKNIILKYDIDQVYLFFSESSFPIWKNEMKYSLSEKFIQGITYDLNEIKTLNNDDYWLTRADHLGLIFDSLFLYSNLPSLSEITENESSIHELRKNYNSITDLKEFQIINLTENEKNKILHISFESYYNSKFITFGNTHHAKLDSVYYFIEELSEENFEFLGKFKNTFGISLHDEKIYGNDFTKIFSLLQKIRLSKEQSTNQLNYQIKFLSALDYELTVKIDNIIDRDEERYIFINCKDDFVKERIQNYCAEKNGAKFYEMTSRDLEKNVIGLNKLLLIKNFDDLSVASQSKVWRDLKKSVFKDGFALFFINRLPRAATILTDLDKGKVWEYNNDRLTQNISKVYHALLCEQNNIELDENTVEIINKNGFKNLIRFTKLNIAILFRSIKSLSKKVNFDYKSCVSWYYFREDYAEKLQYYEELTSQISNKHENIQNVTFSFIKETNSWLVKGLSPRAIPAGNTKTLLYTILTIEYNNKNNNKGISPYQLIILSDYYEFILNNLTIKKLEKKLERELILKNDRGAVERMLYDDLPTGFDSNLKILIKKRIKFNSNKVVLKEKIEEHKINSQVFTDKMIYTFEVIGFPFDYNLFESNFKELITKKVFR